MPPTLQEKKVESKIVGHLLRLYSCNELTEQTVEKYCDRIKSQRNQWLVLAMLGFEVVDTHLKRLEFFAKKLKDTKRLKVIKT